MMASSRFILVPALYVGKRPGDWVTADELVYASDLTDELVQVPEGFVTDLASIPRRFQAWFPVNGLHRLPAIVHDYLYRYKPEWCTRELADQIFLEGMIDQGEGRVRRQLMYWAVRVGGRAYWAECRKCKKGKP